MKSEGNMPDIVAGISGAVKHSLSRIPGLGEAISGWETYNKSKFERNVKKTITHLQNEVADLESLFSDKWLQSEEGQQFSRKVFDSAFDAQLEDKQELFVNALINGIENKDLSFLGKMKFVDILRHLSLASLMVLADMHNMFKDKVRGPGRVVNSSTPLPHIDPIQIAQTLSTKYDPYLVTSAIDEMKSQGLFNKIGEWKKEPSGSLRAGAGFATELTYTDFTYRFVEFVTRKEQKTIE